MDEKKEKEMRFKDVDKKEDQQETATTAEIKEAVKKGWEDYSEAIIRLGKD